MYLTQCFTIKRSVQPQYESRRVVDVPKPVVQNHQVVVRLAVYPKSMLCTSPTPSAAIIPIAAAAAGVAAKKSLCKVPK